MHFGFQVKSSYVNDSYFLASRRLSSWKSGVIRRDFVSVWSKASSDPFVLFETSFSHLKEKESFQVKALALNSLFEMFT